MKRVNILITENINSNIKRCRNLKKEKEHKNVAEEFGVKKNTISTWISNRTKIIDACEFNQVNSSRKKLKKSDKKDLGEAVFTSSRTCAQKILLSKEILSKRKP